MCRVSPTKGWCYCQRLVVGCPSRWAAWEHSSCGRCSQPHCQHQQLHHQHHQWNLVLQELLPLQLRPHSIITNTIAKERHKQSPSFARGWSLLSPLLIRFSIVALVLLISEEGIYACKTPAGIDAVEVATASTFVPTKYTLLVFLMAILLLLLSARLSGRT